MSRASADCSKKPAARSPASNLGNDQHGLRTFGVKPSVLNAARDGSRPLTGPAFDLAFASVDGLKRQIDRLKSALARGDSRFSRAVSFQAVIAAASAACSLPRTSPSCAENSSIAAIKSPTLRKMPRRKRFSVRSRKNLSTMLSHEALVGVK